MKKFIVVFLFISVFSFSSPFGVRPRPNSNWGGQLFPVAYAQGTKTTAAVMDLEAREGVSKNDAITLSNYLRSQLFKTQKFTIVTRENMEEILKEQKFQYEGCVSKECVVSAGKLLGARKMLFGSIGKLKNTYLIT